MLLANVRPRYNPDKIVHIKRKLQGKGQIKIAKGIEVIPSDIIGNFSIASGYSIINLASELGVSPTGVEKYLQKKVGQRIFKGELLALKKGLFKSKIVTAPTDGLIESLDPKTGNLRLEFINKPVALTAGVFGIVDFVDTIRGEVWIKTQVSELYGVLGVGIEREGELAVIDGHENLTSARQIQPAHHQQIIVAGSLILNDTIKQAVVTGVSGIISGGINADAFKALSGKIHPLQKIGGDSGLTIVAIEGFGSIPIGLDIWELLIDHQGSFTIIEGNYPRVLLPSKQQDSIISLRKVALPLKPQLKVLPEIEAREIEIGSQVKVIWPPFMGMQGKVVLIDQTVSLLPSGISSYLLTIESTNRRIRVPYPNVELI